MSNNFREMLVDAEAYREAVEELMFNVNLREIVEGLEALRVFYQKTEAIGTDPGDLYSDFIAKKFLNLYNVIGHFLEEAGRLDDVLDELDGAEFLADDMESDLDI